MAVQIVHDLGLQPLGFSVNGDSGATLPAARVRANLVGAQPVVVISHMNHPGSGTAAGYAGAITDEGGRLGVRATRLASLAWTRSINTPAVRLLDAQGKAAELFIEIERHGLIRPGVGERRDVRRYPALAQADRARAAARTRSATAQSRTG
ncbi:hypothetical protein MAUB1S_03435 [Mycolicibacterium aubagnense]